MLSGSEFIISIKTLQAGLTAWYCTVFMQIYIYIFFFFFFFFFKFTRFGESRCMLYQRVFVIIKFTRCSIICTSCKDCWEKGEL